MNKVAVIATDIRAKTIGPMIGGILKINGIIYFFSAMIVTHAFIETALEAKRELILTKL
ncbi:MAG: hypothetical protein KJO34_11365 [Deltaproteobacteria bacterium]|nr:hypothetical protein [Deltaproteobacteria bacterium]